VSGQKLKVIVRLLAGAPRPWRRRVGAAVDGVAALLLRRRSDHPVGAPLRVIAGWAMGRGDDAIARAVTLGVAPSTDPRTALRLARAALSLDAVDAADRIAVALVARDAGETPRALALRADIALRTGRYSDAVKLADRAIEGGRGRVRGDAGGATVIRDRAAGELRVLSPGWRPTFGARAARGRLTPVRGRVLHLLTNSLPYREAGYTVRTQSIALSQRDVGLEPHLATRAGFPLIEGIAHAPYTDLVDGIPYHRLAPDLEPGLGPDRVATATARAAARLVAELRPALLHPASNFLNAQVALALGERFGIPVVYEVRGFLEETWAARLSRPAGDRSPSPTDAPGPETTADRYVGARVAETACVLAADAVVTLSEAMRLDIVDRGCKPENVIVVPNAVDIERFTPAPRDEALAASFGIGAGETVVGYISTFNAYEGIRFLIAAAALLRERGRRVRVLLVGDGEERAALEAEAQRLGVADGTVIFTGRVPHARIASYYSVIDVFVVPRTADRVSQLVTPLKPYEAMALERPVVVSDVAALREIVVDGETGLTFRPEDSTDLADVLEPLLEDPGRRATLGRAGREWVAANRTWRQNGERYRALYERLGAV
jgi:glycosyltransferase involved in cell wall biosynthesis